MSASNKKKLRKEKEAAILTEKQQQARAEAKKLKTYTVTFCIVMALVVCIALGTFAYTSIAKTGIFQKNTIAATIGEHKLNTVEFNYFYVDEITKNYADWSDTYGDYTAQMVKLVYGLDITLPLSYQYYDDADTITWGEYFTDLTMANARTVFAIYDSAIANNFTLSEEEQASLDDTIALMQEYSDLFNNGDVDAYIRSMYGTGADAESYKKYLEIRSVATAYQTYIIDNLIYDEATIDAYNEANYDDFTAFTFADKYLGYDHFLHADGNTPTEDHQHTQEEMDTARAAAKEAAESLLTATSIVDFDDKIAALLPNVDDADLTEPSEKITDALLLEVNEKMQDWLSDPARKEGDMTIIENYTTAMDSEGNSREILAGYFVLFFQSKNENLRPLANVRHLLVKFEGGETNQTTGTTTYSDEEKNAAKEEAEALLEAWKKGETTDESFAAYVKEHTDDSSTAEIGGLFNDVKKGDNFVENFLNWTIDPERVAGDTGIVESEYGYHIMYYVGDSERTYRDYLVEETMRNEDFTAWGDGLINATSMELNNIKYVLTDYIIYSYSY